MGIRKTKKTTPLKKSEIAVDHQQQHKEKNISWRDFPVYSKRTGRKLSKTLGDYFSSWSDYIKHGGEEQYK